MELMTLDQQEEVLAKPNELKLKLRETQEVKQIVDQIDVGNQIALLEFGGEPANQISRFADRILSTTKTTSMEDSAVLMTNLTKIMDRFDPKDFEEEKKGLFGRMKSRGKNFVEQMMAKYQTMGSEIDKIYGEIRKYEVEMKNSTLILEQMYNENYNYFMELEKYIVAGEMKVEQMQSFVIPNLISRVEAGDQMAVHELDSARNATELLEQRVFDLEMAKQVAFQTAPQIRMLQRGNTRLIGKINSAFVVTIPVFKNGLIQAVAARRQKLVANSMAELDRRTNEMLMKNAQNISQQSVDIARLSGSPSVKLETMEATWATIMKLSGLRQLAEERVSANLKGVLQVFRVFNPNHLQHPL